MRCSISSVIAVALAVATGASATITGISVPKHAIKAGDKFKVTFHTENAQSSNNQLYAIFGFTPGSVFPNSVGATPFAYGGIEKYEKGGKPFSITLTAPNSLAVAGVAHQNLTVAVTGYVGASGDIITKYYRTVVAVAKHK